MRVETANRSFTSALALPYTNEEAIITILHNDLASIKAAYPDFGDKCWCDGYLEEAYATSIIKSLEEAPFPAFRAGDSKTDTLTKAIDSEWNTPRIHLCFWLNTEATPTPGATTTNPGNWVYKGKLSLINSYGYPERQHRWFDLFTDNISRKLPENARIGVSYQWVDRMFYHTLSNVTYTPNPDPANPLILSRFSETLPALPSGITYRLDGLRIIDGSPLPVAPTKTLNGNLLTISFTNESRVSPETIKAILSEVGNKQKLTGGDIVTIDCSYTKEITSLQPDFTSSPIIVNGTVSRVTRERIQNTVTATATAQIVLFDRAYRSGGKLINRGATNALYYKLGSDVTTAYLIAPGTTGAVGGYNGIIAANQASVDLPTGYTGTVSIRTATGQTSTLVEETYTVSEA